MSAMDPAAGSTQAPFQQTVFSDPTGGALRARLIAQFAEMLKVSDLSQEHRDAVIELLVVIALKFTSVWMHDQRYAARESELIAQAEASPIDYRKKEPINIVTAQELYMEFDGFLVQLKSALDHMVNILHYTLDIKFSRLTTFHKYGDTIIKVLANNVSNTLEGRREAAARLTRLIERNKEWLKEIIDARDRMNHFLHGGLKPASFVVFVVIDADGKRTLYRPELAHTPTKEVMDILLKKLLEFVEYFIGLALASRTPGYGLQWVVQDDGDFQTPRWQLHPGDVMDRLKARASSG